MHELHVVKLLGCKNNIGRVQYSVQRSIQQTFIFSPNKNCIKVSEKRLITGLSLKLGQLVPRVAKNTIHKISE